MISTGNEQITVKDRGCDITYNKGTIMAGFMGLRGMETKNPHDMMRERRNEHRYEVQSELAGQEKRSREKVHEILKEQSGNMSAFSATPTATERGDCENISMLKVSAIMSGRVAVLEFDDTLLTVRGIFSSVHFRHLPVVDKEGAVIGIISDRDFLRIVSPFYGTVNEQTRDVEIMNRKVGMIMTRTPICADTGVTIAEAVKLMNGKHISCLPVVLPGTRILQGIVTWKDVVRAFCPHCFNHKDSARLRTGVHINPESTESARLKTKSAESARLRVESQADKPNRYSDRDAERLKRSHTAIDRTRPLPQEAEHNPSRRESSESGNVAPQTHNAGATETE